MIIKLQNGNILKLSKEESDYLNWRKLSPKQRQQSRINKAKAYLNSGPNITNFWNAFQSYIGNKDPKNPHLNIGIVNVPGRATPLLVLLSAKLMETINNYWKNLGKLKIRLGGNGKYASGILTKPGTAPTTFNGLNINYITSPKGGNVTHKFYTDLGSEYILTKDGFARRIKSPHSNVGSSDVGLHNWNEGTTIFTRGEDGKLFNTVFYKLSDFGFKPGTYGLVKQNGKAKIMLVDPKTKQWREAMFSDVYPTSVKLGLLLDRVLSADYSDIPFIGGHILEKSSGGWHPGSSVAFIEGFKQGGFIKSANARKWKHLFGGNLRRKNILKFLLFGGDVDTRSDSTRKGYHEGLIPYGAYEWAGQGPLSILETNVSSNPNIIVGEPFMLPGMGRMKLVTLLEEKAPTMFKIISEAPDRLRLLMKYEYYGGIGSKLKNFFKTGDLNILQELETWAKKNIYTNVYRNPEYVEYASKGFVKGNEFTPDMRYPISEEGLTIRTAKPRNLLNPITTEEEAQAAKDWLIDQGYKPFTESVKTPPVEKPVVLETPLVKRLSKTAAERSKEYYKIKKEDKANRISKKTSDAFKEALAYSTNDARRFHATGRTYSKTDNRQLKTISDNIHLYPKSVQSKFNQYLVRIKKMEAKGITDKKAYNKVKLNLREYLRQVRDEYGIMGKKLGGILSKLQHGGIVKAQEGTKVNWGLFAIDGISSLASAYLQNKLNSSNGDIAKSKIDMDTSKKKLQIYLQAELQTNLILNNMNYLFNTGLSVDNSAKSNIFRGFLKHKIASQGLAALDQEANNQKSMIDAQISLSNLGSFGNAFNNIFQQGINMYGNYLANKQSTSTPKSSTVGTNTVLTNIGNNKLLSNNYDSMKFLGL